MTEQVKVSAIPDTCARCGELIGRGTGCRTSFLCDQCCQAAGHVHGRGLVAQVPRGTIHVGALKIPTVMRPDEVAEFLLSNDLANPENVEEGLQHPMGMFAPLDGQRAIVFVKQPDGSYRVSVERHDVAKMARTTRTPTVLPEMVATPEEAREWMMASGTPEAVVDERLASPIGFSLHDESGQLVVFAKRADGDYQVEVLPEDGSTSAKERDTASTIAAVRHVAKIMNSNKETHSMKKTLPPCLIIGPCLTYDGPAPKRPKRAKSLQEEILERSGTILLPNDRRPFDPDDPAHIQAHIAEVLAANPGARLADSCPDTPAKELSMRLDKLLGVKSGVEGEPHVIVKTGATPVERGRVEGTISQSSYRQSIAASERRAEEVAAKLRARNEAMPAQRSDGSFTEIGTTDQPNRPLAQTRVPEDKDHRPGVSVTVYSAAEISKMGSFHRNSIRNAKRFVCEHENCGAVSYSDRSRRFCDRHAFSGNK